MTSAISTSDKVTPDSIRWATNSRLLVSKTVQHITQHLDRELSKGRELVAVHYFDYQPSSYSTYLSQRRMESIKLLIKVYPLSNIIFHTHHVFLSEENAQLHFARKRRIEFHWEG